MEYVDDFTLDLSMGDNPEPGNNHAGINVDSVEHELDLSGYREIELTYEVLTQNEANRQKNVRI